MENKKATFSQMVSTIVLFNFGSSVVIGISDAVAQDAWIAILLAAAASIPLFLMYARIIKLFPEKDVFEIMQTVFGKIVGKALVALFSGYAVYLGALVLRDFSEFTEVSALPETPQLPIMILMVLITIYLARSGVRALGKWSLVMSFFVLFVVSFTFSVAIPQFTLESLMPFFEHSPSELARASFAIFSYPFAETVIFLGLAGALPKKVSPYKLFIYAIIVIVIIFLLVFTRNLALIGTTLMKLDYFPSYVAARIIAIGDFLARIEGSISSNFLFAGIVKIAACLLAAGKGIASLFDLENYRPIVLPAGMLILALCTVLYRNTMELFLFLTYYPYFAFPFQVAVPIAVWIGAEVYVKKRKRAALPA